MLSTYTGPQNRTVLTFFNTKSSLMNGAKPWKSKFP